jgi:uncharacterized protein YeaO (DUF488 family)
MILHDFWYAIIKKISPEIIPYICKWYSRDKKKWDALKPQIKKDLRNEVNSLL